MRLTSLPFDLIFYRKTFQDKLQEEDHAEL